MQHQEIYNYSRQGGVSAAHSTFPLFARLPEELRLRIWTLSLRGYRIIKVHLDADSFNGSEFEPSAKPSARVRGDQILSKLLRVNREARQAALDFYHIHLPCQLYGRGTHSQRFTVHLNATYDFLRLVAPSPAHETFPRFLADLREHDAKHVGLLNLAIDGSSGLLSLNPGDVAPTDKEVIVATLSRLHQVFWMVTPHVGRANAGAMGSVRGIGVQFNAGFPILPSTLRFDRLPRDPRPIAKDLERVVIGGPDPREIMSAWDCLLDRWGIASRPSPTQTRYSFLLALAPYTDEEEKSIYSYKDAEEKLQDESARFREKLRTLSRFRSRPVHWEPSTTVGAAFGFWILPVEAGLTVPLGLSPHVEQKWHQVVDVSDQWPELGLSQLHLD